MSEKWAVIYEYDLKEGVCYIAKKEAGAGEVALFDSREEAEEWAEGSGNIDPDLWDVNYIKFNL